MVRRRRTSDGDSTGDRVRARMPPDAAFTATSHPMTTFVVPVDGSEVAERALRPACAFAARVEGSTVLLVTCDSGDGGAPSAYLEDRASLFQEVVDLDTLVIGDTPAEGIRGVAATIPDSVVCMATHGRGGLQESVLGSIATDLVCHAGGPLVLVGPSFRGAPLAGEVARMVVCTDGSDHAGTVAPHAAWWATRLSLTPWVIEVVRPNEQVPTGDEPIRDLEGEAAIEQMERLCAELAGCGREPQIHVLHGADPGSSITAFAERLPASLVAMATHGRTGVGRLAMGSVAARVVRNAPCPVLVVRPQLG